VATKQKATKTGRPAHRPVVFGVVKQRTVKFDAALEQAFLEELEVRRRIYADVPYNESVAMRQLIKEAITAARAARERGQQTLPLESPTTKS